MITLEHLWKGCIEGKGGVLGGAARLLLSFMSLPYRLVNHLRNWAYHHGWLPSRKPSGSFIVSVGNLNTGGTGKTPFVCMLGDALQEKVCLAILSRGYRSEAERGTETLTIRAGKTPLPPASLCGDENRLLAERLRHTSLYIGRNRNQSAEIAHAFGAKVLILDDGFQHRALRRDLDIVLIPGDDPLGGNRIFPRGSLREPPVSLKRAHLLVVNPVRSRAQFREVCAKLAEWTDAPVMGVNSQISGTFMLEGSPTGSLQGAKVGIFCGIAHPTRFKETVQSLGCEVVDHLYSPDHRLPGAEALRRFASGCKAKGAGWLLCTEKDQAKWDKVAMGSLALPIAYVRMDMTVVEGEIHWQNTLKTILENAPPPRQ